MIGPLIRAGVSAAKRFKMKRGAKKLEKQLKSPKNRRGPGGMLPKETIEEYNLKRKGKNPVDRFFKKYID